MPSYPLHEAARDGDVVATRRCLAEGYAVNSKNKRGNTPLMQAAEKVRRDVVQLLLDANADPTITNPRYVNHATPDHLLSQPRPRRASHYARQYTAWDGHIHIVFDPLPFEHALMDNIEKYDWPPYGTTQEERDYIKEVNGWHHPKKEWLQDWRTPHAIWGSIKYSTLLYR